MRLQDLGYKSVRELLDQIGLQLVMVDEDTTIPGSFWGDEEAGLINNQLYARGDTPIHSILHETCHWLCTDEDRRQGLHTNAGGDYDEENAVCYLQILLADRLSGFGRDRCMRDMDTWGYTFRLGSARAWFETDADDARAWLSNHSCTQKFVNNSSTAET
jgi:hypothetical protein